MPENKTSVRIFFASNVKVMFHENKIIKLLKLTVLFFIPASIVHFHPVINLYYTATAFCTHILRKKRFHEPTRKQKTSCDTTLAVARKRLFT